MGCLSYKWFKNVVDPYNYFFFNFTKKMKRSDCLLYVETSEAYTFKVLTELLQNCVIETCFVFDKKGITLTGVDTKVANGTKLVHLQLYRENFTAYVVPEEGIQIGLNVMYLFRMLRTVKKKDRLTLFIKKSDPLSLGIQIPGTFEQQFSLESSLKIASFRPLDIEFPQGYDEPICTNSKEFSKLKCLSRVSKLVKITFSKQTVEFFCDKENIYSKKIIFGDSAAASETDEIDTFSQHYETDQILQLVKVAQLSQIVRIYHNHILPLKIELNVGVLGVISIYIKSKENIEEEEKETDDHCFLNVA